MDYNTPSALLGKVESSPNSFTVQSESVRQMESQVDIIAKMPSLLDLPLEVRFEIYRKLLWTFSRMKNPHQHRQHRQHPQVSIIHDSKFRFLPALNSRFSIVYGLLSGTGLGVLPI